MSPRERDETRQKRDDVYDIIPYKTIILTIIICIVYVYNMY